MKSNKRSSFIVVFIFLTLSVLLAACSSQGSNASTNPKEENELEKVNYAAFDGLNGMAVRFGAEKGFFEDEGIDVEFVVTKDEVASLTSGDVDFADANTTRIVVGGGKGAPIKIVGSMFRTKGPFYLIAKSDIKSVEDLKGKNVGVGIAGSGMDVYTRTILAKHGLTEDDVHLINNGTYQQAYATLETGQVDATLIHEPFVTLGETTGVAHLLAQGWKYLPEFHTGVLASNDKFIKEKPETLKKVLKAYLRSQEYAKANQDEYIDYVVKHVDIEPEVLKSALDREEILWENDLNIDVDRIEKSQDLQYELGFQEEKYDIKSLVNDKFIPKK
ncbi:ABC transporter substrate-binding protein [Neobacillus sp. FSL H8-0543]|uniref:ABC transporter substrate-binding protein n=1 Tax=Neobacillus sp. FSL H8-0543 TaxID=2954672 RepID=UPI0031594C13